MSQLVAGPPWPDRRHGMRAPGVHARRGAVALTVAALIGGSLAVPTLAAANVPPTAGIDNFSGDEDTQLTGNILANDSDPDGGTLTILSVTPPTYGTLVVLANGNATFTPPANYHGDQVATYWLSDGQGGASLGYIMLNVASVNDAPVAVDSTATTNEDTDLLVDATALAAAATDVDGDALSITAAGSPVHGTVGLAGGVVTFSPTANWCGAGAGFDYTVSDPDGLTADATVTVSVTCVNDVPVAVDDTAAVAQGAGAITVAVTANDTDADGDALTVTGASVDAAAGTAVAFGAGSVRYTPAAAFTGDAVIGYTVSDGHGGTDDATLTVTVVKDSDPPVPAVPAVKIGTSRVDERAPVTISWSATDAGIGVASYEVQKKLGSGAWTALSSGARTSTSMFVPFRTSFAIRVRATDKVGNVSGWVTGPTRSTYDWQAPGSSITWSGSWTSVSTSSASKGAYRYATSRGASATLRFTGREVAYVAPTTSTGSYVKVYVDGSYAGRFSLRSASTVPGKIIFRKAWTASGTHTIKVVNDVAGRRANVDVFLVLR